MIVKYKVSDFAKDLNLSAKKVLDELAAMGSTGKKNSSNLEENELNYLLEKFSKDSSVTDLNEFLNSAKAPKEEPKPAEKKAEKKTEKKPEAPKAEEKPAQKPAEKKPEQKAQPAAQQNQQAKAGSKHGDKKNEQHKKREEKTVSLSELARETGAKASTAPAQAHSLEQGFFRGQRRFCGGVILFRHSGQPPLRLRSAGLPAPRILRREPAAQSSAPAPFSF